MKDVTIYEANNRIYTTGQDGRVFSHIVLANGEILLEHGLPDDEVRMDAEADLTLHPNPDTVLRKAAQRVFDYMHGGFSTATIKGVIASLYGRDPQQEPAWVEAVPMHDPSRQIAMRVSKDERERILALRNGTATMCWKKDSNPGE